MTKAVLALVLLVSACTSRVSFRIDNPTDAPLAVTIDGKEHMVGPHADAPISLDAGRHSLEAAMTGKVELIVYAGRKGGLINPTLSDYVVVNEIYATNAQTAKGFMKLQNTIVMGGERFTGPFRMHDDLFIDEDWRYGVHDDFPESEAVGTAGGNIVGKVFAGPDFVTYYRRRYGVPEPIDPPPAPKARRIVLEPPLPSFADPEVEKATAVIRDQYQRYIACEDPSEQKRLQEATSAALTAYVTFMAPRMINQSPSENQRHNDFVTQYGHAFGVSARVVPSRKP